MSTGTCVLFIFLGDALLGLAGLFGGFACGFGWHVDSWHTFVKDNFLLLLFSVSLSLPWLLYATLSL